MKHLDLFSGIGGFAIAVEAVWPEAEHIFCDNDKFCQQVLKKHWPNSKIYGDIRQLTADTEGGQSREQTKQERGQDIGRGSSKSIDIITGGFPCQPFSQAGKRRGTEDDRYLWPEMLRVIREFHPRWVIGENVGGFVTWNNGMVLNQVCADLEEAGYEVQPFIIPACAVNAPHRRDRVWIVAHRKSAGTRSNESRLRNKFVGESGRTETTVGEYEQGASREDGNIADTERKGYKGDINQEGQNARCGGMPGWNQNWLEVATKFCGVDDGLPVALDGFKLTKAGHRVQRLKSLGNAIVPQVAIQIMKVIKTL